jgi:hypothetical protein
MTKFRVDYQISYEVGGEHNFEQTTFVVEDLMI